MIHCLLQLLHLCQKPFLDFHHPLSHLHPGAKFVGIEGFDHVVVGADLKPGDDILLSLFAGPKE